VIKKRNSPEADIQIAVADYLKLNYPKIFITASVAGIKMPMLLMKKLKRMGYTPGTYDLFIGTARHGYFGLFLEAKFGKNDLSDNQKNVKELLENENYKCDAFWSVDEALQIIDNYMKGKKTKDMIKEEIE
jgi:hypothetical protein